MEVYIIRHTEVALEKGFCYGQTDVDVKETYLEEFDLVRGRLPITVDKIISSPLQRCTKLAIELSDNFETDDRLKEMDFGDWEMMKWTAIGKETLDKWAKNLEVVSPDNGENLQEVYNRVVSFMDELRAKEYKRVIVVTHSGIIRCIWAYVLQSPLQSVFRVPVGFNELFSIQLGQSPGEDFIVNKK